MRYVPDWRNRPEIERGFLARHEWLVPALLLLATLVGPK